MLYLLLSESFLTSSSCRDCSTCSLGALSSTVSRVTWSRRVVALVWRWCWGLWTPRNLATMSGVDGSTPDWLDQLLSVIRLKKKYGCFWSFVFRVNETYFNRLIWLCHIPGKEHVWKKQVWTTDISPKKMVTLNIVLLNAPSGLQQCDVYWTLKINSFTVMHNSFAKSCLYCS